MISKDMKKEVLELAYEIYNDGYKDGKESAGKFYTLDQVEKACEAAKADGYQRGLDDAWDCVRKMMDVTSDLDLEYIFNTKFVESVINTSSPNEVLKKIEQYEKNRKDSIHFNVGDELVDNNSNTRIIYGIDAQNGVLLTIDYDGFKKELTIKDLEKDGWKKTGKWYNISFTNGFMIIHDYMFTTITEMPELKNKPVS